MTLVRMLVDGCGLLHQWTEIAPQQSRFSRTARAALLQHLSRYSLASGLPVCVVFEGPAPAQDAFAEGGEVEVFYGQPRQQVIAALAGDPRARGAFRVVTDDPVLRDTIFALGGTVLSHRSFRVAMREAVARFHASVRLFDRNQPFFSNDRT